VPETLSEFGT